MTQHGDAIYDALVAANRSRADLYVALLRVLERRVGRDAAVATLKEAIHEWGRNLGEGLQGLAPADFAGLRDRFALPPDDGELFGTRVDRCDAGGMDVQFERCPLKAAWQDAGLSDGEVVLLCEIACEADHGTMEAAGFAVEIETWKPGQSGCCMLRIRPKPV